MSESVGIWGAAIDSPVRPQPEGARCPSPGCGLVFPGPWELFLHLMDEHRAVAVRREALL